MKRRYFLWDAKRRYRGLFSITEERVETLRTRGWYAVRAGTPFGRVIPPEERS